VVAEVRREKEARGGYDNYEAMVEDKKSLIRRMEKYGIHVAV
jgi:hypothetical protein